MGVRAQVRNGRLVVDEPTELPEGTVVNLVVEHEGDELDARQRAALDAAIDRSLEDAAQGRSAPAEQILRTLTLRRRA